MNGTVLVIMEQRGGVWTRMSFETLAAGQQLAAALGTKASAAVAGDNVQALTGEVVSYDLDKVYAVEHALLKDYTADAFTAAIEQLVKKVHPAFVLFPHTYQVRDFAPKLATRFDRNLISDVTAIRNDNGPVFVRQLFQGKLNADVRPLAER